MDQQWIGGTRPDVERAFHPGNLILARESRGYSQAELSRRANISQGAISKIESGSTQPSAEQIRLLAQATEYPVSFLCDRGIEHRPLPGTFYRKRKALGVTAQKRIEASTAVRRMHLASLLRSAVARPNNIPLHTAGSVSPRSVAMDLRRHWRVPRGPVANMMRLLEEQGAIVLPCDFGSDHIAGLSFFEARDGLPPVIVVDSNMPGDRLRFTLAHELAHMVLHNHVAFPPDDLEDEADVFASEFLMPSEDIRGHFGRVSLEALISMKAHWRVSIAALIMRAEQLGKITDRQKRYLFSQLSARGYRLQEPVEVHREEPTMLRGLIDMHLRDLEYTREELAEALRLLPTEFGRLYEGTRLHGLHVVR